MKFLESFSDREPIESQVKMWEEYLDENYKRFYDTEFGKRVAVDDKSYYLKDKSQLTDQIVIDIKNSVKGKIHEGSLRRAIKNWIDRNNI
jgi:hypothetical protein